MTDIPQNENGDKLAKPARVRKFRTFFSVAAEEKLLNRMGEKKYLLVGTVPFFYIFEKTETVWSYGVEWLDSSPLAMENKIYIGNRCENENLRYCGKKNCFVYLAAEGEIPPEKSYGAKYMIKKRYRSLSVFWSVLSAYMVGLLIYNIAWANKFKDIGYKVHDDVNEIERVFTFVVGKNPAVLFLYAVIPATALTLATASLCWTEYYYWIKKCPRVKKQKKNKNLSVLAEASDEKPQL